MKVITISGKAESGKDFTAMKIKEILEQNNYNVLIIHYGDLLKYLCKSLFGWDGNKDLEGRYLLQNIGTRVREYKSDYWVSFVIDVLTIFNDEWDYVLIPDARFPNEIELIKEHFDTLSIKIIRPDHQNRLDEVQRNHVSETALDSYKGFDDILTNDGSSQYIETLNILFG